MIDAEFMRKHFTHIHVKGDKPRFTEADRAALQSIVERLGMAVTTIECTPAKMQWAIQVIVAAAIDIEELLIED